MSRIARLLAFWIVPVGMVLTNCSKPALGQDDIWSMPRGNAAASGWSPHTLPDSLAVAWEFKADEAIETTPVVDAERVYFADVMGTLYAVSRESGSELWRNKYDTGFLAAPVVVDDRLVIGDIEGNVYAVSSVDGKKIWTRETEGEISGAAGITGDKALVASQDGKLYCFELADGKLAWEYQADDQIRCSPTIAGDRTFLGGCDSQLHVIDLNTGKAVGDTLPLGGPTGSTPAVLGDRAILPIMDGSVFAFDWKAKKQLWRYEDLEQSQEYRNSAAVSKEFVVISSERRQVDALDAKTGERQWRVTLKRRADASPVIAGNDVWVAASDGRLIRLDLKSGKQKWEHEIRGSYYGAPAITEKELFIADDDGVVRCFRGG